MRRKFFGLAIAAIATLGPMQVHGGDREIAQQIIQRLKVNRESGALKDFTLDMKVDKGVVLFRGNVGESTMKDLVLGTAAGIDGITKIVDEVKVTPVTPSAISAPTAGTPVAPLSATAKVVKPEATKMVVPVEPLPIKTIVEPTRTVDFSPKKEKSGFSLSEALAAQADSIKKEISENPAKASKEKTSTVAQAELPRFHAPEVMPGEVRPAAAVELNASPLPTADDDVVSSVIDALGNAQRSGELRGFGVDVTSRGGMVNLTGRAASSAQRDQILNIARNVPGVGGVRDSIRIIGGANQPSVLAPMPSPTEEISVLDQAPLPQRNAPQAQVASVQGNASAMSAQYRMNQQQQMQAQTVGYGGGYQGQMGGVPTMGQPVPMAPYSGGAAAPRYDSPNLPNYAWPGYAAYPNYAALTYPQQYSPSAWPYIGPFYPYPQVPLGWRKVSLEWDDGWWFLDFTDR